MSNGLGAFQKLDVRQMWANEASGFTPWLAEERNMALLGEALGLELEVENVEVAVGPYAADILAKDMGTGRYVVIENQLGKTDHDHLGKVIAYAAVLDASTVVWIASEFTEEHQKALDWLNEYASEDLSFYGVLLELWQIDDSRPAVRFNVVSRPAGITRVDAAGKPDLSEARTLQLDFWTTFREKLLQAKVVPSAQKARGQYWFDVALGRSGFCLSNIADTYGRRVGVRVYISNKVAPRALPQLLAQKEEIEKELGEHLEWDANPEARDKIIALYHTADIHDRAQLGEQTAWLVSMVAKFRKVFMPRVRDLDLGSLVL
jgi:hypothetical protein